MKVKSRENIRSGETNGIENLSSLPAQLTVSTDLEPDDIREILSDLETSMLGASAISFETKIFLWHLDDARFRD